MKEHARQVIVIACALGVFCLPQTTFAQIYQVGVPVCDTIGTGSTFYGYFGGCGSYDCLLFKLNQPILSSYVTGLNFQIVITETIGRVWSDVSDTVKVGDVFSLLAVPTDSLVKIFMGLNSSFKFITRVVGTPNVAYEEYYCEIKLAFTLATCRNFAFYYGEGPICQVQPATSVVEDKDDASSHSRFRLLQNYPNPFNPETVISYTLPKRSLVELKIYDMLGHEVRTLINEFQQSGSKSAVWDGKNNQGQLVPSGQYFYRLTTDGYTKSSKSLLLR